MMVKNGEAGVKVEAVDNLLLSILYFLLLLMCVHVCVCRAGAV